jgi:hypothetical protein
MDAETRRHGGGAPNASSRAVDAGVDVGSTPAVAFTGRSVGSVAHVSEWRRLSAAAASRAQLGLPLSPPRLGVERASDESIRRISRNLADRVAPAVAGMS